MLACTPQPDLGAVRYVRAALVHVVDASTCADRVLGHNRPLPTQLDGVRIRASKAAQTLVVDGRPVFTETQRYRTIGPGDTPGPIVLLGRSRGWVFFTTDPGGSASIAADGLVLRVVAAAGGRVHRLGPMLPYPDYLAWCGGRLVFSGGGDRLATSGKRLLAAGRRTGARARSSPTGTARGARSRARPTGAASSCRRSPRATTRASSRPGGRCGASGSPAEGGD